MLKKIYIIVFCILTIQFVFAQDDYKKHYNLNWKDYQEIHLLNNQEIHLPCVYVNQIDLETLMPYFSTSIEIPFDSEIDHFFITDIVYENLSPNAIGDLNTQGLKNMVDYNYLYNTDRDKKNVHIKINPIINQKGVIKKVVAFTVNFKIIKKVFQRSFKTKKINSVLAKGNWYKFMIEKTGIYKIDYNFMKSLGIDVEAINFKNLKIYGNGGKILPYKIGDKRPVDLVENAVLAYGQKDGHFDKGDYILLFAQGADHWIHNDSLNQLKHINNIYDDNAYYFITIGNTAGKRIANRPKVSGKSTLVFKNYDAFWVHEEDKTNLCQAGQRFLGSKLRTNKPLSIDYNFKNLDTSVPLTIKIEAVAQSTSPTKLEATINKKTLKYIHFSTMLDHNLATSGSSITEITVTNPKLNLQLSYNKSAVSNSVAYLDYIEIIGKKKLIADDMFLFRNFDQVKHDSIATFKFTTTKTNKGVWDVTDINTPMLVLNQASGSVFQFNVQGGKLNTFITIDESKYLSPKKLDESRVENQDLHSITTPDYLIITNQLLQDKAEDLAEFHRVNNNYDVKVVPLYQIYNEFSSGSQDITAIRDFIKYVYDLSKGKLKYVLMYGDASFDFKGIEQMKGVVPAFQSYRSFDMSNSFVTDDFYVIVSDDNEGDLERDNLQTQDIAISRIPVNSVNEAEYVNKKIFKYYNPENFGDWRNDVLMIADDVDKLIDKTLQETQEQLARMIVNKKPQINIRKLWMDAYKQETVSGGQRYPEISKAIDENIEKGVLMVNYFGHGGESGLSLERIIEAEQVSGWSNFENLNLFSVISCEFARFDNPLRPNTVGELLIRHPQGGAVHEIATAREIGIDIGSLFNKVLTSKLLGFDGSDNTMAECLRLVKNTIPSNQRYFVFSFGDPAMHLALPKTGIKITSINNNRGITKILDTIRGLSKVNLKGIVTKNNGKIDTGFNGELTLTIFDKSMERQTLNNDGVSDVDVMTFKTQESKLFKGKAEVVNGKFSIDFILPKDIRIAYGIGKFSFYAHNNKIEKGGSSLEFIIGGIDSKAPTDNEGPEIELYMDNVNFKNGGKTSDSPLFLAYIKDEHGINTSLSSVDHDIIAILDDDHKNPIILNNYFVTKTNDFTSGQLEYRFRNLAVGTHKITLVAYDNYNNSSTKTLIFKVGVNVLKINGLSAFPNPFSEQTTLKIIHNKPSSTLQAEVNIFTSSGYLVRQLHQTVSSIEGVNTDIIWDGTNNHGSTVVQGVYICQVILVDHHSGETTEAYCKIVCNHK